MSNRFFWVITFLLVNCSSYKVRSGSGTPLNIQVPSCGCKSTSSDYTYHIEKSLVEEGIVRYSARNSIMIDPELRTHLVSTDPSLFLRGIIIKEEEPVRAVATFDDSRLERVLKTKPFTEELGVKVYKRRGSGIRGLEVIKGFQKQNRNTDTQEDTDKFVGDRVDNIGRFRNHQ